MSDIDAFASSLLEEAKRFLERASEAKGTSGEVPYLHAALMLAFCSLEAHVNAVADEQSTREDLSPHVRAVLLEKEIRLEKGEFVLDPQLRMNRLEDRIQVLHRIGPKPDASGSWLSPLKTAIDFRNKLTHPKEVPNISIAAVTRAVEAVIDTIDALYQAIYKRRFPAAQRKLSSAMDF